MTKSIKGGVSELNLCRGMPLACQNKVLIIICNIAKRCLYILSNVNNDTASFIEKYSVCNSKV